MRSDAVNAVLLNEFLKEHCKVEQLTKDLESQLVEQQEQIEALTAGLQKVSDQLELSKPAPQSSLTSSEADYRCARHSLQSISLSA
jgi:lipid A disaccharide synthetase